VAAIRQFMKSQTGFSSLGKLFFGSTILLFAVSTLISRRSHHNLSKNPIKCLLHCTVGSNSQTHLPKSPIAMRGSSGLDGELNCSAISRENGSEVHSPQTRGLPPQTILSTRPQSSVWHYA